MPDPGKRREPTWQNARVIAPVLPPPAVVHARSAGYDVVLLAHVLAAVVGLGAVVLAGTYAWLLRRSGPGSEPVRRYYRPGVNWGGRVLVLVPVLGVALVAMGRQIEADYQDKPLTIVAVLTGSLIALADLVRQIRIPLRIALLQASSYRGATTTATTLVINEAFAPDVSGRDVLLLDDILDTGQTLSTLVRHIQDRGASTVRTAVLLRKIGRQVIPIEPDYCGFIIPDVFVVGYGLDYNDEYRHLPYVGVLEP